MRGLLICFVLWAASAQAAPPCIDPSRMMHSLVRLERTFPPDENGNQTTILATAWFLDSTLIVTNVHVATGLGVTDASWRAIQLSQSYQIGEAGDEPGWFDVRLHAISDEDSTDLAVMELDRPYPGAIVPKLRHDLIPLDTPVMALGYTHGLLCLTRGQRGELPEEYPSKPNRLHFELDNDGDRLAMDFGSSGSLVFDCQGRVVGTVTDVRTQMIRFLGDPIRVSTPWGTPNVMVAPVVEVKKLGLNK